MLACRAYSYLMFLARKRIKHSRMALLHKRCAEILEGEDAPKQIYILSGYLRSTFQFSGRLTQTSTVGCWAVLTWYRVLLNLWKQEECVELVEI
jgi:hypothetical protein